jgi:hypothetical protein
MVLNARRWLIVILSYLLSGFGPGGDQQKNNAAGKYENVALRQPSLLL